MSNNKQSSIEWLKSIVTAMIQNGGDADLLAVLEHIEQAKEMNGKEMEQHAINFYLFVENDEVTDQKVEIIENLYEEYLKQFYN